MLRLYGVWLGAVHGGICDHWLPDRSGKASATALFTSL
jgi:hypothetical protein